jgi:regulator of sirC expression with transglutaminase-like and TPR domain
MDATAGFADAVQRAEAAVPLDQAMLLIAAHATPDLSVSAHVARLDELAVRCSATNVVELAHHLFVELGFTGNHEAYYEPENSFLDQVLDRRLGIPISLSVLAIEVGRRAGIPVVGIGMPGHFLVRSAADPDTFIDPFARGSVLDRAGCMRRFTEVMGAGAPFDDTLLAPVGAHTIISRVLANLQQVYAQRRDLDSLHWVQALLGLVPGAAAAERSSSLRRAARWN